MASATEATIAHLIDATVVPAPKQRNSEAEKAAIKEGRVASGLEAGQAALFKIMDRYVEAGGNALDTADVSIGGKAEETGKWFASRPADMTDSVLLTSKGRATADPAPGPNGQGLSRRYL